MTRRLTRIWPAHLAVLGMMAAFVAMAHMAGFSEHHQGRFEWADLGPQMFLIQAWADVGGWGWNIPTWSLSALVFCYAVFPLAWRFIAAAPVAASIGVALGLVVLFDILAHLLIGGGLFDLPFYLGAFRALPLFLAGAVIARLAAAHPVPPRIAVPGAALAAAGLAFIQTLGRPDALSVALIALIVLFVGSIPVARPVKLFEQAGKLSFALFITHGLVAVVWFGVLHVLNDEALPLSLRWALWAGSAGLAIGFAWLFDRWFDQPVQAVIGRWLGAAFRRRRDQYPAPARSA